MSASHRPFRVPLLTCLISGFCLALSAGHSARAACQSTAAGTGVAVQCDASPPTVTTTPPTFSNNDDRFLLTGGTVNGSLNQAGGADQAEIRGGTLTGTLSQGDGVDNFVMSGGTLGSLTQGDSRDTFTMTGGTISGAFEDGDVATMSGGTIGRVDMKLDNNIFDMSGGHIIGNLVTGFGNDTIIVSGSSEIGGNVSLSGGSDSVTLSGGRIGGEIRMSTGDDLFRWQEGGVVNGAVLMGEGNDSAELSNLSAATVASTPQLDGGNGTDSLALSNVTLNNPARLTGWESISMTNGSTMTLDSALTLGDSTSRTGTLALDATSSLLASGNSLIHASAADAPVTVNNAGTLDLTQGSGNPTDTLTIQGNYVGQNGIVKLQTVLGDETSASDRLVIAGGGASGNTTIALSQVGGEGAYTAGNGIELISAINGGTTSADAFSLRGGSVSAGAYEYVLFRGGVTAGSENNWYLRNALITTAAINTVPVEPEPPTQPAEPTPPSEPAPPPAAAVTEPVAAPGSPALPQVAAGSDPVPLYRPETALYSALPPVAFSLGVTALGTFHDRQGGQILLKGRGDFPASWARVYGSHKDQQWSGDTTSSFNGNLGGFQVGQDLFARQYSSGQRDHAGLFYNYSRADGDVNGSVLGFAHARAGKLKINGNSVGGYWTHLWQNNAYLDAVVMHTWLDGSLDSSRNLGSDVNGKLFSASLEGGYPIPLSQRWVLEPQGQIITQHLTLDRASDGIAALNWDNQTVYTGRTGVRLQGNYGASARPVQPYLKVNLWHDFDRRGQVKVGGDSIAMQYGNSALEIGVGITATVADNVNLYAAASQTSDIDSDHQRDYSGNMGVRINW